MPYTIPSSVISPGSVYQPRQIPAVISQNARALYYTRGGSISGSLLLDQSPLNLGTRRTGEEGRYYLFDGIDDYVTSATPLSVLSVGTPDTVTFMIKKASVPASFEQVFSNYITSTDKFSILIQTDGTIKIAHIDSGAKGSCSSSTNICDNDWHRVSAVFDGVNTGRIWIDGVEEFGISGASSGLSTGWSLGSRIGSAQYFGGGIFDFRIYNYELSISELNFIDTWGQTGQKPLVPSFYLRCDEQSGTTAYDSSGNGNNGTLTNITAGTFHATQDIWSFQNQVGFNTSGAVYIPRDESNPTNDVLGNPLTNTGRRPNDAALHSSNCLTADGTLYIAAAHLAGTETVVSSGGTSTPSISAGRIDFTAGTCWDLTLSDGTHYPLSEGWGVDIGSSTSDNDGVLTNSVLANAWGATQNEYHYNLISGFSLYEHASTAAIRWPFKNGSVKTLTPPTGYSKTSDNYPGDYHNNAETLIDLDPDSTPEMGATQLGITVPASHAFGDAFAASTQIFSRQRTLTEDRFVVMPEAQTGSALATIQKYTQP